MFHVYRKLCEHAMIGIFFSAGWSPPCNIFLNHLTDAYYKIRRTFGEDQLAICLVSYDTTRPEFDSYREKVPWVAIPWAESTSERLKAHFNITGVPHLVVINNRGQVVVENARGNGFFGMGLNALDGFRQLKLIDDELRRGGKTAEYV